MNYVIEESWCLNHLSRKCVDFGIGVQLGGQHLCLRCARLEVGLPEDATAEQVIEAANQQAMHKEVA